ncbi:MAG: hypothetical protein IPL75_21370 [Acidobacteria bacterium]|nr:hypothetical protein [Acidobacteriota bacterium]
MTEHSAHRGLPALWDDHARFDPLWAVLSSDDKRHRAWDLRDFMKQGEREIRPMVDSAYQANLDLCRSVPGTMAGGETRQIVVRVTNTSPTPWVQREVGSLRVGDHWFDESGELMVAQDDGRASMPQVVPVGGTFEVDLSVTAPRTAGKYRLEVDVVHEGISWFAAKGSPRARALVSVVAQASDSPARLEMDESPVPAYGAGDLALKPIVPGTSEPEAFPMYGMAKEAAVDCLQSGGGDIVAIEDDPRAGPEWRSFRYFVRKA